MRATEVIVVRDDVPRTAMRSLAEAEGWRHTGQTDRGHLVVASDQWSVDDDLTVTWVEDHTSDVRSVRVAGKPDPVRQLAAKVRETLPHHPRAELLEAVATAQPRVLIGLAGKLASCRPANHDAAHLAALRTLLSHHEVAVRRAALRTAYRYPWPQLQAVVAERYEADELLAPQLEHLLSFLRA